MASAVFNFSSDILSEAYSAHLLCPFFLWVSHSPWAAACSLLSSVWLLCLELWLLICCLGGSLSVCWDGIGGSASVGLFITIWIVFSLRG